MKAKFIHFADVHLGYEQYSVRERFNDFAHAFLHVIQEAVNQRVDFVLLAGDLFHKRSVDPLALTQALEGLQMLQRAKIPVIAVEGNHERASYQDQFSWMDFLDHQGHVILLNPTFDENGNVILRPHSDEESGAYLDVKGVRVYGMKYFGAATARVIEGLTNAVATTNREGVEFSILLLHCGIEGILPHQLGLVSDEQLGPLKEYVDYIAMGHLHKPFERGGWVFNPGSLETVTADETQWPDRGYYLVELDTERKPKLHAKLIPCPRRDFLRLSQDVAGIKTPQRLYESVERLAKRESHLPRNKPIVEIELRGILPFDINAIDWERIREIVTTAFDPLNVLTKNSLVPSEFEVAPAAEGENRSELEHRVLQELFERDARFQPQSSKWADLAIHMKRMVLEETSPSGIVDYVRKQRSKLVQEA